MPARENGATNARRMWCREVAAHPLVRWLPNLIRARSLRTSSEGEHTNISTYGEFPKRLQLTLERSETRGALVAKRLDSGVLASRNWRVVRNNSIEISPSEVWITNGWFIELSRSGAEFRGAAHYWTDTGDRRKYMRIGLVLFKHPGTNRLFEQLGEARG